MKRVIRSIMAVAIVATIAVGYTCTSYAGWWNNSSSTTETTAAAGTDLYSYVSGTTTITVGTKAADVIKALGQYKSVYEAPSCAYQGNDKIYTYEGFEVSTYVKNNVETVNGVYLTAKTVATKEGVKIGDTVSTLTSKYGKDYKLDNGVYRYTKGDTELSFYTKSNAINNIEYTLIIK